MVVGGGYGLATGWCRYVTLPQTARGPCEGARAVAWSWTGTHSASAPPCFQADTSSRTSSSSLYRKKTSKYFWSNLCCVLVAVVAEWLRHHFVLGGRSMLHSRNISRIVFLRKKENVLSPSFPLQSNRSRKMVVHCELCSRFLSHGIFFLKTAAIFTFSTGNVSVAPCVQRLLLCGFSMGPLWLWAH